MPEPAPRCLAESPQICFACLSSHPLGTQTFLGFTLCLSAFSHGNSHFLKASLMIMRGLELCTQSDGSSSLSQCCILFFTQTSHVRPHRQSAPRTMLPMGSPGPALTTGQHPWSSSLLPKDLGMTLHKCHLSLPCPERPGNTPGNTAEWQSPAPALPKQLSSPYLQTGVGNGS